MFPQKINKQKFHLKTAVIWTITENKARLLVLLAKKVMSYEIIATAKIMDIMQKVGQ